MKESGYDVGSTPFRIGREFIARRLHSLAGFAFLLFLCEHLFTNSQATLFLGSDGKGFIDAVNFIHSLPYLQAVEIIFIGLPLFVHIWWGISRIRTAKINSIPSDGTKPSLPYTRNIAFTWQRITSIVLIFAIGLHVYYMRFLKEPQEVSSGVFSHYFVKLSIDQGLYTVAPRLNLVLFDKNMIDRMQQQDVPEPIPMTSQAPLYSPELAEKAQQDLAREHEKRMVAAMKLQAPDSTEVVAMCNSVGTAFLMVLRDSYKSVWLCCVYSIFVVLSAFHGCNGLWTFAITWGVSLSERSRSLVRLVSNLLMMLLIFFGLACIWGVYWINLRY